MANFSEIYWLETTLGLPNSSVNTFDNWLLNYNYEPYYFDNSVFSASYTFPRVINFNNSSYPQELPITESRKISSSHSPKNTKKSDEKSQDNFKYFYYLNPKNQADIISDLLKTRYLDHKVDGVTLIEEKEIGQLNIIQAAKIIKADNPETTLKQVTNVNSVLATTSTIPENNSNYLIPQVSLMTFLLGGTLLFLHKCSQQNKNHNKEKSAWYNLPFLGTYTLWKAILKKLNITKQEVSESSIFLHERAMTDLHIFAGSVKAIDDEKFSQKEFILFAKIKYYVDKNLGEYQGLAEKIKLLKVALKAQKYHGNIHQMELNYQGSKHNEFYQFVEQQLKHYQNAEHFRIQLYDKMSEILPEVRTEEGKQGLQNYVKTLIDLSQDSLALNLFCTFKLEESEDYLTLKSIANLIARFSENQATDYKHLLVQVMADYDTFEKLQSILKLSKKQNHPDTYAHLLQYVALEYRYQTAFSKFDELIHILKKWYNSYQILLTIRQQYPSQEYQQPSQFSQNIPGLHLYLKYKKTLTDKKTGYTYINFESENEAITDSTDLETA